MSTKIYEAYRVKRNADIWPLLHDLGERGREEAKKVLRAIYTAMLAQDEMRQLVVDMCKLETSEKVTPYYCGAYIRQQWGAQLSRAEKNDFDLEVSLNIFHSGKRFYIIPYPGSGLFGRCLEFLKEEPRLEDFAYWNNSDRPDHISARAWGQRARIWDRICKNWQDKVNLSICSYDAFHDFDPAWDMTREQRQTE